MGSGLSWSQVQAQVQYDIEIAAQAAAVAVSEVAFWVGNVLVAVAANASGDIGAFAAGQEGLLAFAFAIDNAGVAGALQVSARAAGIATKASAEAGASNTELMTPLRTKEAIDAQRPLAVTQTFAASAAWIKPDGAVRVRVREFDGGSGGSGGAKVTSDECAGH